MVSCRNPIRGLAAVCLIVLALFSTSCANNSAPVTSPDVISKFADTLEGVCNVWQKIRGKYPQIREAAKLLHDLGGVDEDTWAAFVYVDSKAGDLDRWLQLVCDARAGAANAHVIAAERSKVDWNAVGAAVLKVTSFAIQSGLL